MDKITNNNVGVLLVNIVPEFESQYNEYLIDNDHEKLTHILFGVYLFPFFKETLNGDNQSSLSKIGKFLSDCFEKGDENINNAIHVSFFENMTRESYNRLSKHLSKKLDDNLKEIDKKYHYFI